MAAGTDTRAVRGRLEGRVQGVAFRASMQRQARRQGVLGWVRNAPDGAVEFLVQGAAGAVTELLDWARAGPPGAKVDRVEFEDAEPADGLDGFQVRF